MSGKGDTPRPLSVPQKAFAERWARTFGRKSPVALKDLADANDWRGFYREARDVGAVWDFSPELKITSPPKR